MAFNFARNKSLKEYTSFKIGGYAQFFCSIHTIEDAKLAMEFVQNNKIKFFVLGKGSNCLIKDGLYEGLAILNKIQHCSINKENVVVGSGYSFPLLGTKCAQHKLAGLEFSLGIPASVGGAIFMNAGSQGSETATYLEYVLYLHKDGTITKYDKKELHFGYRTSFFQDHEGIILEARFIFPKQTKCPSIAKDLLKHRLKTQPYKELSIGCIFQNPATGVSAGALIEECALKGVQIGGAKISNKHANFIINQANASCKDVLDLILLVQKTVEEKTGYVLHPEIRYIS